MKKHLLRALIFFLGLFLTQLKTGFSQVPLDTFLGMNSMPTDDEAICEIPMYPEVSSNLEGPFEGTLVHDFKLYTLEGDSVRLSGLLNDRKPVVLISCSYTCFVFRHKLDQINNLLTTYGDAINVYLVYTVEAHPIIDYSPYFGEESVGDDNYEDGILYRQPTTYGERKDMVAEMLANETVNVPVLIDGPCNDWWQNFGTVPNGAFLIDPDGYIYDAQNWFNKNEEDMYASIDEMLDIVGAGTFEANGTFTAEDEGEEIYDGIADYVIAAHITLTNNSTDDVLIDFLRTAQSLPEGWETALCTDLCYSPEIDSTTVYLLPGQTEEVRVDFFTNLTPASGNVSVTCRNHNDASNIFEYTFYAQSVEGTSIQEDKNNVIQISPNPVQANESLQIIYPEEFSGNTFQIRTITGAVVEESILSGNGSMNVTMHAFSAGTYFLAIQTADDNFVMQFIVN